MCKFILNLLDSSRGHFDAHMEWFSFGISKCSISMLILKLTRVKNERR